MRWPIVVKDPQQQNCHCHYPPRQALNGFAGRVAELHADRLITMLSDQYRHENNINKYLHSATNGCQKQIKYGHREEGGSQ